MRGDNSVRSGEQGRGRGDYKNAKRATINRMVKIAGGNHIKEVIHAISKTREVYGRIFQARDSCD